MPGIARDTLICESGHCGSTIPLAMNRMAWAARLQAERIPRLCISGAAKLRVLRAGLLAKTGYTAALCTRPAEIKAQTAAGLSDEENTKETLAQGTLEAALVSKT